MCLRLGTNLNDHIGHHASSKRVIGVSTPRQIKNTQTANQRTGAAAAVHVRSIHMPDGRGATGPCGLHRSHRAVRSCWTVHVWPWVTLCASRWQGAHVSHGLQGGGCPRERGTTCGRGDSADAQSADGWGQVGLHSSERCMAPTRRMLCCLLRRPASRQICPAAVPVRRLKNSFHVCAWPGMMRPYTRPQAMCGSTLGPAALGGSPWHGRSPWRAGAVAMLAHRHKSAHDAGSCCWASLLTPPRSCHGGNLCVRSRHVRAQTCCGDPVSLWSASPLFNWIATPDFLCRGACPADPAWASGTAAATDPVLSKVTPGPPLAPRQTARRVQ